jgi:hypothetical protein
MSIATPIDEMSMRPSPALVAWTHPRVDTKLTNRCDVAALRAGPVCRSGGVMREFRQLRETWDYDTQEVISDFIHVGDRVVVRTVLRGVQGP